MSGVGAEAVVLVRVLVAALLGGVLGWERLSAGKWVGVRTLMLVALSSALFGGISGFAVATGEDVTAEVHTDPIRVVQAVAIGIGFLGAGVVHVDRERGAVHGLTTAASVWATAAVGIAAGLGKYLVAVGSTSLLLFVLRVVAKLEPPSHE